MRQKYIINANIEKIIKIKVIKTLKSSTNNSYQKMLSDSTYSNNTKNNEDRNKCSSTSCKSSEKQLQEVTQ